MNEETNHTSCEKKPDKTKIILIVVLAVVSVVALYFGVMHVLNIREARAQEAAETQRNEYISDMQQIALAVTFGIDICTTDAETLLGSEAEYYANCHSSQHAAATGALLSYFEDIDNLLQKWSDPPEEYEKDYGHVSEACQDFKNMARLIINPADNQEQFYSDFIDAYNTCGTSYLTYLKAYADSWTDNANDLLKEAEKELN